MNCNRWLMLVLLCGPFAYLTAHAATQRYDPNILAQVETIYGLSEEAAISRLANEYTASVQARSIEEYGLPSYAGAWFDSTTQSLHVAVSNRADFSAVERIGATPVMVAHNLRELEAARASTADALTSAIGPGDVRESYIDYRNNAVVFGVAQDAMQLASAFVATLASVKVPVQLKSAPKLDFSSNLYGADGTQNYTWYQTYLPHVVHPCSVGASAEKVIGSSYVAGFATAGHCGSTLPVHDIIQSSAGASLGTIEQSSFDVTTFTFANNEDGAWVKTYAGWLPQPQVNGYTNGILNISGTWAGTLIAPVGTTACRYGEASGGPHCAPVSALNVTACFYDCGGFNEVDIRDLTKINGICTANGDSGGTIITPSNQVQGTDTGGTSNSCPDISGDVVYFQPIATTLSRATSSLGNPVAMLTSHGRSAPTVSGFRCPDRSNSGTSNGIHMYTCDFVDFDSQGVTNIAWTSSTGASSNTEEVSGTCAVPGPAVNVTLAISNPYGTTTINRSFSCPTYPIP